MWLITYTKEGMKCIEDFSTIEALFERLQNYYDESGDLPLGMCVFKAKCLYDGS